MYKKPFKYDEHGQYIVDANGEQLCMMRGWSYLSKTLGANTALEVQDHWGELIVSLLNQHVQINLPPKSQSDKKQDNPLL